MSERRTSTCIAVVAACTLAVACGRARSADDAAAAAADTDAASAPDAAPPTSRLDAATGGRDAAAPARDAGATAACRDSGGALRVDFCGDDADEDCDGTPRACEMPSDLWGPVDSDVTLLAGLALDRDRIDLWALSTTEPDGYLRHRVRVTNRSGMDVLYSVDDDHPQTLAAGASILVSTYARHAHPSVVTFWCAGCTMTSLTVGYFEPPEPPTRFVGTFSPYDGGEPVPATLEIQVVPVPVRAGRRHARTLRECVCWTGCDAHIEARITLAVAGGPLEHRYGVLPDGRPRLGWDGATRRLGINLGSEGVVGVLSAGLSGPPEHLTGMTVNPAGELVLHPE